MTNVRFLSPTRQNSRPWLVISASILLLLTSGCFLFSSGEPAGPAVNVETQPGEAPREVTLPDGTKTWLRENSRLEYPETFAEQSREIVLTGEAYFEVAENPDVPFKIALPGSTEVEVLGTSFLVKAKVDSLIEVTVSKGRVALNVGNKVLILPQGKAGSVDPATRQVAEQHYLPNAAAWRNNTLVFNDQPLANVVRDLEIYFKVAIYLSDEELLKCRFNGRFPDADIEVILDAMEQFNGVSWNAIDDEYQLRGGDCQ